MVDNHCFLDCEQSSAFLIVSWECSESNEGASPRFQSVKSTCRLAPQLLAALPVPAWDVILGWHPIYLRLHCLQARFRLRKTRDLSQTGTVITCSFTARCMCSRLTEKNKRLFAELLIVFKLCWDIFYIAIWNIVHFMVTIQWIHKFDSSLLIQMLPCKINDIHTPHQSVVYINFKKWQNWLSAIHDMSS